MDGIDKLGRRALVLNKTEKRYIKHSVINIATTHFVELEIEFEIDKVKKVERFRR